VVTTGIAPAWPNRRQNTDFPAETAEDRPARSPAKPNPDQDADDLTNPELCGLNRFSSDFLR
jgi:hypothetical protein